ncbi:MAG: hypothetical protein QM760_01465 [Nibricoccus sp.]
MNFDEIQSLWAGQISAPPAQAPEFIERQRALLKNFKQRRRMLGYGAFCISLGLIFTPLLSIVNYRYLPGVGTPLYWVSVALHLMVLIASSVFVFRRLRRHRALGRVRISTLREQAQVLLVRLGEERSDYRWLPWMLGIWGMLAILSIIVNTPFHGGSLEAVTLRIGLTLGFLATVAAVVWRHYHVNLLPAYARQQEILKQME